MCTVRVQGASAGYSGHGGPGETESAIDSSVRRPEHFNPARYGNRHDVALRLVAPPRGESGSAHDAFDNASRPAGRPSARVQSPAPWDQPTNGPFCALTHYRDRIPVHRGYPSASVLSMGFFFAVDA